MNQEIERKFFVTEANLEKLRIINMPFNYEERYYLYRSNGIEIRITKITKPDKTQYYNLDRMQLKTDPGAIN